MKKFLPLIFLLLGVLVLVGVFFLIKGKKEVPQDEEEKVPEIAFENRPITSLTPSEDGHWLKLQIDKVKIKAKSLDYELFYKLPDGRTQGVPGTVDLSSTTKIERDLLLGSAASGKCRDDEGVKEGTLTLRFRNDKGKLMAKFTTSFALSSESMELSSVEGKFKFSLNKSSDAYFVVMETFGAPDGYPSGIAGGPYGVFVDSNEAISGVASFGSGTVYAYYSGNWTKLDGGKSQNLGIFVS